MCVTDSNAVIEIQIDFNVVQSIDESQNRHFGLYKIELLQDFWTERNINFIAIWKHRVGKKIVGKKCVEKESIKKLKKKIFKKKY